MGAKGKIYVVLITTSSKEEAFKISRTLVEERLAACANIMPKITSVYRWQGKVEEAPEALIIVKTTSNAFERLVSRVRELHSYTVPEIIALPVEAGYRDYLNWVVESTH
ncbi:MAG: divalent-cation tolerance protein CutA [Chloroflexi bacterium]|nr:MAG: divalent-cation tolerance protein CutA [Chloroflexota bacterium]HDN80033.1 divalent-cation tolerance protein CutA [Chloroflexota bacterium]